MRLKDQHRIDSSLPYCKQVFVFMPHFKSVSHVSINFPQLLCARDDIISSRVEAECLGRGCRFSLSSEAIRGRCRYEPAWKTPISAGAERHSRHRAESRKVGRQIRAGARALDGCDPYPYNQVVLLGVFFYISPLKVSQFSTQ